MLLILESDARRAAYYERCLGASDVRVVRRPAELASSRQLWDGVVTSVREGSAFEFVARLRAADQCMPILFVIERGDAAASERAARLLAYAYVEPIEERLLREFAVYAKARRRPDGVGLLRQRCRSWAVRYALTPTEREILRLRAAGLPRAKIAIRIGHAMSTLDRHAKNILAKTCDISLDDAVIRLLSSGYGDVAC